MLCWTRSFQLGIDSLREWNKENNLSQGGRDGWLLKVQLQNAFGINLGASLMVQFVKNLPAVQETAFNSWVRKIWWRDRLLTPVFLGFPCCSAGKESTCGFDFWVGKIPWRRERISTLIFWPGEFHGLYSPWGHKELDMTERLSLSSQTGPSYRAVDRSQPLKEGSSSADGRV